MHEIIETLRTVVGTLASYVWEFPKSLPWLVVVLLGTGLFVTLRLAFIQLRHLGHSIRAVMGKYDDPDDPGDVNHFQALSTALSATVGIGNIAGVAIAIHFGGPGALFWMWVTAVFGMALKYSECTLALHYRVFDDNGEVAGGPMYYIENGLGKAWKPMALFFAGCAVIASFGGGNMNQANTVAASAASSLGVDAWMVGAVLVVIVGAVILGGIKSIARVTSRLAPSMAVLYVLGAIVILILEIDKIPWAFGEILGNAFTPAAGVGGSVAGVWIQTMLWGVRRGLFSNEAGQGSAPIAHAAAKTDEPVREGAVAMLEPLIDTLIICTMTGLVVVITGVWDEPRDEVVPLPSAAVFAVGSPDRAAPPGPVEVSVSGGLQSQLGFVVTDAPMHEPVMFPVGGDLPFEGVVRYDPAATPSVVAVDAGGQETAVELRGGVLQTGAALTMWAFEIGLSPLGGWGHWVVALCVFLFGVSTMISWSYYGDRCVTYLLGTRYVMVYRVLFLAFVYIGATIALETVWKFSDVAMGMMTVPNLLAVILLSPKLVSLTREYFAKY